MHALVLGWHWEVALAVTESVGWNWGAWRETREGEMEPGREMDPRRAVAVMDEEGLCLYSVRRLPDAFVRVYLFNSL